MHFPFHCSPDPVKTKSFGKLHNPLARQPCRLIQWCAHRQLGGVDAFTQGVVHAQVALGIEADGPNGVVVWARPAAIREVRSQGWDGGAAIAGQQRIDQRADMARLPCQQHSLVGELATGKEIVAGGLGYCRVGGLGDDRDA